ncbi:MAG: hypothetical protein ACOYL6_15350 [Bacteriovoracaceae bacterium]
MKAFTELDINLAKYGDKYIGPSSKLGSANLVSYFLRSYYGNVTASEAIKEALPHHSGFDQQIDMIRDLLRTHRLDEAKEKLQTIVPETDEEKCEYLLEKARQALFSGEYQTVIDSTSDPTIHQCKNPVTRMTIHQIRGHAYIELSLWSKAESELQIAILYAKEFTQASSAIASYGFMIMIYCHLNDKQKADEFHQNQQLILDGLKEKGQEEAWLDRYLIFQRSKSRLLRRFGTQQELESVLAEAFIIAKWANNKTIQNKCQQELAELGIDTNQKEKLKHVHFFAHWIYLEKSKIILSTTESKIERLESNPLFQKMILVLKNGPIKEEDFFRQIWNLPFSEKHSSHLRANLSKLRKKLPSQSLKVTDQFINLT